MKWEMRVMVRSVLIFPVRVNVWRCLDASIGRSVGWSVRNAPVYTAGYRANAHCTCSLLANNHITLLTLFHFPPTNGPTDRRTDTPILLPASLKLHSFSGQIGKTMRGERKTECFLISFPSSNHYRSMEIFFWAPWFNAICVIAKGHRNGNKSTQLTQNGPNKQR